MDLPHNHGALLQESKREDSPGSGQLTPPLVEQPWSEEGPQAPSTSITMLERDPPPWCPRSWSDREKPACRKHRPRPSPHSWVVPIVLQMVVAAGPPSLHSLPLPAFLREKGKQLRQRRRCAFRRMCNGIAIPGPGGRERHTHTLTERGRGEGERKTAPRSVGQMHVGSPTSSGLDGRWDSWDARQPPARSLPVDDPGPVWIRERKCWHSLRLGGAWEWEGCPPRLRACKTRTRTGRAFETSRGAHVGGGNKNSLAGGHSIYTHIYNIYPAVVRSSSRDPNQTFLPRCSPLDRFSNSRPASS